MRVDALNYMIKTQKHDKIISTILINYVGAKNPLHTAHIHTLHYANHHKTLQSVHSTTTNEKTLYLITGICLLLYDFSNQKPIYHRVKHMNMIIILRNKCVSVQLL